MGATGYYFDAKVHSRAKGHSAVGRVAYRCGEKLEDERNGETRDFSRKRGVELVWHTAPSTAPEWAHEIGGAWNAVERSETRKNSTVAREHIGTFPHQFDAEERAWVLKDYMREEFTRKNLLATGAIHAPSKNGDQRNYHAHIMFSDRPIDENGFAKNKDRSFTEYKSRVEILEHGKEKWAELNARMLERKGLEVEAERWRHGHLLMPKQAELARARGDYEYAEQVENREPSHHMGVAATALERQGIETEIGNANREIMARNQQRLEIKQELQQLDEVKAPEIDMKAAGREVTAPEPLTAQPEPVAEVVKIDRWKEERERAASVIREAWQTAERDPVSFAIELGEQGLTLAENDKGRFVAVDERGGAHYLTAAALGEKPLNVQRELEAAFKSDGSVSLPSVDEVRAELKEQREAERAESALGWAAHRRAEAQERAAQWEANRRAEARERAAQWEANREIWKEQRQLDRQIERVERAQERPQNAVIESIGRAWADSSNGAEFVHELEQRGLTVCRVNSEEAERSKNQRALLKTASYQEGEYLAVTEWGAAYRLNAETIALTAANYYDHHKNVTERLAEIEPQSVVTFHQAQEIVAEQRQERAQEQNAPTLSDIGAGVERAADALDYGAGKVAGAMSALGEGLANMLEGLIFGGDSRKAPGGAEYQPPTAAPINQPEPAVPEWKKAKDSLRTTSPEEAAQDPQAQATLISQLRQADAEITAELRRKREKREIEEAQRERGDDDDGGRSRER